MDWHEHFYYDESSPSCLRWKNDRRSGKSYSVVHQEANSCAGSMDDEGYWRVKVEHKSYQVHRIIYELLSCESIGKGLEIDHQDRCRSNNRFENLALVSKTVNLQNKSMYANNTSGTTGVRFAEKIISGKLYTSWLAIWREDGRHKEKWFSCNKYGDDQAFQLACEYRAKMIAELNAQGAGYTSTHGQ